ncbi:MAG: transglutaminase family protein [Candidatus Methanomethylicia archaeon]
MAYKIINVALNFAEVSESKTPVENIKNILSFIHQYIHYEYDLGDTNSAPVETLAYKSGDCDDFGILAAALFKSVGINVAIARFKNKDVTASKQGHIMVLVRLDDLGGYGYFYYSSLTNIGLTSGKWIIIEPQYTIDYQGYSQWFNQWQLVAAVQIS